MTEKLSQDEVNAMLLRVEANADYLINLGKKGWTKQRKSARKLKEYMLDLEQQERLIEIEEEKLIEPQR